MKTRNYRRVGRVRVWKIKQHRVKWDNCLVLAGCVWNRRWKNHRSLYRKNDGITLNNKIFKYFFRIIVIILLERIFYFQKFSEYIHNGWIVQLSLKKVMDIIQIILKTLGLRWKGKLPTWKVKRKIQGYLFEYIWRWKNKNNYGVCCTLLKREIQQNNITSILYVYYNSP